MTSLELNDLALFWSAPVLTSLRPPRIVPLCPPVAHLPGCPLYRGKALGDDQAEALDAAAELLLAPAPARSRGGPTGLGRAAPAAAGVPNPAPTGRAAPGRAR